jgi:hypothetical protein
MCHILLKGSETKENSHEETGTTAPGQKRLAWGGHRGLESSSNSFIRGGMRTATGLMHVGGRADQGLPASMRCHNTRVRCAFTNGSAMPWQSYTEALFKAWYHASNSLS